MLGSLYSAVSGLSAHQTKMNVVGNNIANINTYGFKSSRVTFTDVFYQTLSTASSSSADSGGSNPTQLGYGSQVNSIDVINKRAGSTTTDRSLDIYINGDGYLAVQGSDGGIKYTRVGILSFDSSGNLVDSSGNILLGLTTNETTGQVDLGEDGTTDTSSLTKITVDPNLYATYTNIAIGDSGEITATQAGDPEVTLTSGTGWVNTATLDPESNLTGEMKMTTDTTATAFDPGTVNISGVDTTIAGVTMSSNTDMLGNATLSFTPGDATATPPTDDSYTLTYTTTSGETKTATATDTGSADVTFTGLDDLAGGNTASIMLDTYDTGTPPAPTFNWTPGTASSITLGTATAAAKDITLTTYLKSGAAVTLNGTWNTAADASTPITWNATTSTPTGLTADLTLNVNTTKFESLSDMTSKTIGSAGAGDGKTVTIGNIAVVKFANADGLSEDGEGYYTETANSGSAVATVAGKNGTGDLLSGALESSNVDLSKELTEMIITQRGFQANSKMITVSDEMLDTLVNMKR